MKEEQNYTGIYRPENFSTAGPKSYSNPAPVSKNELIEIWFIEPLKKMEGHQAFVCLSVCLFLYEKYLKKTDQIGQDEKFSKGHKVFDQMGKDFEISAEEAYEFWTCWRNGLAHHGMPKISERYHWGMTGGQKDLVVIDGDTFTVNPWLVRDKILNKVENKKRIWDDELAPLMKVFKIMKP